MLNYRISRRRFTLCLAAAGGSILLPRRLPAAEFNLRSFHNQPADSPLHKRLIEMWSAVATETHGRVHVETFADNNQTPGGDPAVLKMLVDGRLEFFNLNGGLIGTVVPAVNVQGIPFVFRTQTQVYRALDGDLGDYLGQEMRAKGIYDAPIYVECWRALGATPVIANFDKLYETLQTHAADAQDNPLNVVELLKLYEVQKYESLTSHMWSGFNLIANLKAWERLPADVQAVIQRNAARFARLQRADNEALNNTLRTRLADRGMTFNTADAASFKAMLGGYYARWKQEIGQKTWTLLERHVGKLG